HLGTAVSFLATLHAALPILQSHGIAARSYGGNSGVYVDSGGIVHFTSEQAGTGGAGGTVVITTGDASQGQDGGVIVTRGSNSFGDRKSTRLNSSHVKSSYAA